MKKQTCMRMTAIVVLAVGAAGAPRVAAHCEIPCGIYGDRMRIDMLEEHCRTVEKSMKQVEALSSDPEKNANQLVRWVVNKEDHADKIQEIVYQYFMNQRISPVEKDDKMYDTYVKKLTLLHGMLVQAMKCKQTTDVKHVENLRSLIDRFEQAYFEEEHKHTH